MIYYNDVLHGPRTQSVRVCAVCVDAGKANEPQA